MKPDTHLIVANWKMQLPFNSELNYAEDNYLGLKELTKKYNTHITLCPSFPVLSSLALQFLNSHVHVGAQDCSQFQSGAYTGQVSARSLSQAGCHYCIVGHSERRDHNRECDQEVSEKVARLLEENIQPIICIGENELAHQKGQTIVQLKQQLDPIIKIIRTLIFSEAPIYIAYEPIWSIGTGKTPTKETLNKTISWINQYCTQLLEKERIVGVLYGGSVSKKTVPMLKEINDLSGLLIGGASLNFQKFNNIVNLYME